MYPPPSPDLQPYAVPGPKVPNYLAQRSAWQDLQVNQMKMDEARRQMASRNAFMRAWTQAQGDPDKAVQLAAQSGQVLPETITGFQQHLATLAKTYSEARKNASQADRDRMAAENDYHDMLYNAYQPVADEPDPDKRAVLLGQVNQTLLSRGVKPQDLLTPQNFDVGRAGYRTMKAVQVQADTLNAETRQREADLRASEQPGEIALREAQTRKTTVEADKTQAETIYLNDLADHPEKAFALVDQIADPRIKDLQGLNARTKAQIQFYAQQHNGRAIDDAIKAARQEVAQVEIATNPRVNAARIAVINARGGMDMGMGSADLAAPDPNSQSILAQTGLSYPAFLALSGQAAKLPRDARTRAAAFREAQNFANKRGVDVSTLATQFQAFNTTLQNNIQRQNNTKIMEAELEGTIENLRDVVKSADLYRLNFANVAKIWAGQEINDPLAQQYAMHLYQLRNELAAYGAATQGRTGNNITLEDMREAQSTIRNGIALGSLEGLRKAVRNSTDKMGRVMQNSVDAANKAVWGLFGVGQNYKPSGGAAAGSPASAPLTVTLPSGKKLKIE